MSPPQPRRPRRRGSLAPLALVGTGVELAGILTVLVLLGWWLDQRWATSPWLILTGAVVGIVGCIYKVWLLWRRMFEDDD